MGTFKREDRYLIIKRAEAEDALDSDDLQQLATLAEKVAEYRAFTRHKEPLQCVVVEHDWPEYEVVWAMIQERVRHENT